MKHIKTLERSSRDKKEFSVGDIATQICTYEAVIKDLEKLIN